MHMRAITGTLPRTRQRARATERPVVASTYTCSLLEPTTSSKADISFSCACGMFVCVYARTSSSAPATAGTRFWRRIKPAPVVGGAVSLCYSR